MHLIVEIGNTHSKFAVFDGENLLQVTKREDLVVPIEITRHTPFEKAIVAGSGNIKAFPWAEIQAKTKIEFLPSVLKDFQMDYETPNTLGQDRIINTYYASKLYPKMPCLIIDMGTCITLSFIDSNSIFQGGSISPGLSLRAKSLNDYTAHLPLVDIYIEDKQQDFIGKSTRGSIISGILKGVNYEIERAIEEYKAKYLDLNIIMTGGSSPFFENKGNYKIFADPNFTLRGLNYILLHNV